MAKKKIGRPKGSGGKQPNWSYTKGRKGNMAKARKVITEARKKSGIAIITSSNKSQVAAFLPKKKKK